MIITLAILLVGSLLGGISDEESKFNFFFILYQFIKPKTKKKIYNKKKDEEYKNK